MEIFSQFEVWFFLPG